MSLVGIIPFNIHDDKFLLEIPSQHYSSCSSVTCLALQNRKAGLEQVIQQCTFSCILSSNDGDCKIILIAVTKRRDDRFQSLLTILANYILIIFVLIDELICLVVVLHGVFIIFTYWINSRTWRMPSSQILLDKG